MAQRRRDRPLHPRLDVEERQSEPLSLLGERTCRRRQGPRARQASARERSAALRADGCARPAPRARHALARRGRGAAARARREAARATRPRPHAAAPPARARCATGRAPPSPPRACPRRPRARPRRGSAPRAAPRASPPRRGARARPPAAARPPRAPLVDRRKIELRDPCTQASELADQLLGALGGGCLERERTQPLAHLLLDVARALGLRRDARELQLRPVAPRLELAEPRRLLQQHAPLGSLRAEDLLDLALADDRVHAAAETDVGEQLDEVEPADRRLVDEVLALAAAVEPPRDRHLRPLERPVARLVVEEQLDLAVLGALARLAEPAKRTSSGFSARSSCGASEPAAQTIASATFDFPEPFGPTTTATPGSSRISTGSGNDLKPRSLIARRCTRWGG